MRRRDFISGHGAAASWPMAARAQSSKGMRRVGVLTGYDEGDPDGQVLIAAFRREFPKFGWIEGTNLHIDTRYAAALLALKPDVMFVHGTRALGAIRQTNPKISVVFAALSDPVGSGVVSSL